jgi:hypothetical protein
MDEIDGTKREFISMVISRQIRTAKALKKQSHDCAEENRSMTSHPTPSDPPIHCGIVFESSSKVKGAFAHCANDHDIHGCPYREISSLIHEKRILFTLCESKASMDHC